jgi:hypothetical protein
MGNTKSEWGNNFRRIYRHQTTFNKDEILNTSPHYTDKRFDRPQTVFGQKCEGLKYDYSDRLWQWDQDKSEAAGQTANASGAIPKSCRWYEEYLSAYFSRPIEIKHILVVLNHSNRCPYI